VKELGEVFELSQGLQISSKLRISTAKKGYIPLLKITDLQSKKFSEFVSLKDVGKNYIASKDDIIYTRTGQVGLVYTNVEGCVHNNCFKIHYNKEYFDKMFIYYMLKQRRIFHYANNVAGGSVQKDLSHPAFKSCIIAFPNNKKEQIEIAKILSSLDDKIELNQRMNKTLEAIAQAIFKHWFIDFEFPNEEGKPYKSSGGEMVYNEELGKEIPKGWRVGRLEEIANLTMGLSPKGESYNEKGEGLPLLNGAADFSEGGLSPKKFTTQPVRVCKREDIVFCIRATIGNITFSDGIYCLGRGVAALSSKEDVYKEFIYFILNHHLQRMSSQASGTVIVGLKKNDINNLTFIMPPKKFIEKFHGCISHLFNRIKLNFEEIDSLSQIRDVLLPKLMSGEIRVKDMEET